MQGRRDMVRHERIEVAAMIIRDQDVWVQNLQMRRWTGVTKEPLPSLHIVRLIPHLYDMHPFAHVDGAIRRARGDTSELYSDLERLSTSERKGGRE
jgi:hypothetical protein